jgi:hypothetical protein
MRSYRHVLAVIGLVFCAVPALAGDTPSPAGANVYFITPTDGAKVKSPFAVKFGLTGMGVAPAGVDRPKTGHHHLIVDAPEPDPNSPIPSDANHLHFGGGQTETTLTLPPGKHTLQLIMGDQGHVPHNPVVKSQVITVTVE